MDEKEEREETLTESPEAREEEQEPVMLIEKPALNETLRSRTSIDHATPKLLNEPRAVRVAREE